MAKKQGDVDIIPKGELMERTEYGVRTLRSGDLAKKCMRGGKRFKWIQAWGDATAPS